ncbi:MAG: branched-chain-amino-acid transaminase [Spirochaetales bacterium]|nr:branched-chain-amino-acid transaminase [Spirochaetales bacterium]
MKIYIDGKYHDKEDAKIPVFDHGLLYGDGIFEGIRVYGGKIFKLREHLERLYDSAKAILLAIPMDHDAMQNAVEECVSLNRIKDGYIRLVVTRGAGDLGIDPRKCPVPCVIIIAGSIQLYPAEYYSEGIPIITASTRRNPVDSLDPRIKSLNYLNNILAKWEAIGAGCLEAVLLNNKGYVAECTGDNIFIIKNDLLITPKREDGALEGITRRTVLDLAPSAGLKPCESSVTVYDLYTADECFLTGTGAELMPVTLIDGRKIGEGRAGEKTKNLIGEFRKLVYSEARTVH